MIINRDFYECPKCGEICCFDTPTPESFSPKCPKCDTEMIFDFNDDCDTEIAEKFKDAPTDFSSDPNSPFYSPIVECPYCHSTNTRKHSDFTIMIRRAGGHLNIQWHCDNCDSDF